MPASFEFANSVRSHRTLRISWAVVNFVGEADASYSVKMPGFFARGRGQIDRMFMMIKAEPLVW